MLIESFAQGPVALASSFVADPKKGQNDPRANKPQILIPGVNRVDNETWSELRKNPIIQRMMAPDENGKIYLKEVMEAPEKVIDGEAQDLSGLTAKDASAIVAKCLNKELLDAWSEQESRPKVRKAIDTQLKKLQPGSGEAEQA